MIRKLVIPWISSAMVLAAAESPDLMRFANGDQLHGTFRGIKEGAQVVWQRDDLNAPVEFKSAQLRHIVLRGGRPAKSLTSFSHLALVNGDSVPGTITDLDADTITLATLYAGTMRIPRNQVTMLAAQPSRRTPPLSRPVHRGRVDHGERLLPRWHATARPGLRREGQGRQAEQRPARTLVLLRLRLVLGEPPVRHRAAAGERDAGPLGAALRPRLEEPPRPSRSASMPTSQKPNPASPTTRIRTNRRAARKASPPATPPSCPSFSVTAT